MSKDELYKKAEKRADAKIGFYHHLYSFIAVNVVFFIIPPEKPGVNRKSLEH